MHISVIMPALNAASTIAEAVASLQAQTHSAWEAVVVDNGSSDDTATVVAGIAEGDARIRLVSCPRRGVSVARNYGIGVAGYDRLMFLDADDTLVPRALATLSQRLSEPDRPDIAYCGWQRIAPDGDLVQGWHTTDSADLFSDFAVTCAFPIHACLVPKALVTKQGGFDEELVTCEDWDLWQRIARAGATFGRCEDFLANYRMRPASASNQSLRLLKDAITVIRRGHGVDPRVVDPVPAHASGLNPVGVDRALLTVAAYTAGTASVLGEDLDAVVAEVSSCRSVALHPDEIALSIFVGAMPPAGIGPSGWRELFERIRPRLDYFLSRLEAISGSPRLEQRTTSRLMHTVLASTPQVPGSVGNLQQEHLDVSAGFGDVAILGDGIERLLVQVSAGERRLGAVELPVVGTQVPSDVIADAISVRYFWEILSAFLERHVYPELRQIAATGSAAPAFLAEIHGEHPAADRVNHDDLGWVLLLQGVFDQPNWSSDHFYDDKSRWEGSPLRVARGSRLRYELLDPPPTIMCHPPKLTVEVVIAGRLIGLVDLQVRRPLIRAGRLVKEVLMAMGTVLGVSATQAALVGPPWSERTLREQLMHPVVWAASPKHGPYISRRNPYAFGLSSSRRSQLPHTAEIEGALRACGEEIHEETSSSASHLDYRPEVLQGDAHRDPVRWAPIAAQLAAPQKRSFFDHLFSTDPDPWGYSSEYERRKYEQTLAMLPRGQIDRCLEIGCASGDFTIQLAARVRNLVAADISPVALGHAVQRCAEHSNVSFIGLDLASSDIPGRQDVIVCSEILYYLSDRTVLDAAARRISAALVPGGHLVMAHAHLLVDDPQSPGFDWENPFGAETFHRAMVDVGGLRLEERAWTPYYRIERYQRPPRLQRKKTVPPVIREVDAAAPPPEVAQRFSPDGAGASTFPAPEPVLSEQVPILMYHRVAHDYVPANRPWCVTPEQFAAQMAFLAESGFHSITLEDWWQHANTKRALPGRPFILTFDDGFDDFAQHAWPVLSTLGFAANVFLVTSYVGRTNAWDPGYDISVPLMTWDTVRALEADGVRFGSHTATHQPLSSLTVGEIASELMTARETLTLQLRRPLTAVAYPYGDVDDVIEQLAGTCGYDFGLTCRGGRALLSDLAIDLPRIDVSGTLTLDEFRRALTR